jgi:hypothetical protein
MSAQVTSSPHFFLSGAASPQADVITLPHHVTLSFYGAKTSSLSPLHLLTTIHPVASSLEPKLTTRAS